MAVTVVFTPVLQKAEKCRFYQEIGGCYKGTIILKNSVPIRSIPFKCIFVRLEKALMRGKQMNAKFHWHYISVWSIGSSTSLLLKTFQACTARFVSDLVGNPEDRFSHDAAHISNNSDRDGGSQLKESTHRNLYI